MPKSYLLTGMDEETYSLFKSICSFNDISVKDALLRFIRDVVHEFDYSEMVRKTNSALLKKKED